MMRPAVLDDDLDLFLTALLAGQSLMNLVRREFDAEGVGLTAWGLLVHVHASGQATPSQLATETGVTATTIRDQIQSLVERGLLRRRPNPEDSRSYRLELTAAGKRELEAGRRAVARADARIAPFLDEPPEALRRRFLRIRDAGRAALE